MSADLTGSETILHACLKLPLTLSAHAQALCKRLVYVVCAFEVVQPTFVT